MKTQILTLGLLLATQSGLAATFANSLAVNCTVKAQVTSVSSIKYNPGLPPQGRFNGVEPTLTFQAYFDLKEQSAGCEVLKKKYGIYFGGFTAYGSKFPADPKDQDTLQNLIGQTYELDLKQDIGYQSDRGYLPLFPLAHKETLNFAYSSADVAFTVPLKFDVNCVYSITSPQGLSDIQKLYLAEKTKNFVFQSEFLDLFLKLEPQSDFLKKSYAYLIWSAFNQTPNSQILRFHVGGQGSEFGAPLIKKFNSISHISNTFSSTEIIQLLTDFPQWILVGYSENECLNFSANDLEASLENIHAKLPALNSSYKYMIKDAMAQIAGQAYFLSNCTDGKVSAKAKDLANDILLGL